MLTEKPFVSVIIPCYDEAKNLEQGVLDEVYEHLMRQDFSWEVIVVNDESTDNSRYLVTRSILQKEHFCLHDIPHGGKPAAIWAGIQKARGSVLLLTDMDQSTPIAELNKLLPWFQQGFDMVIGSRGLARDGSPLIRKIGSLGFRTLRRFFLLRDIIDTQCGFKLCSRHIAMQIFPQLWFCKQKERPNGWTVTAFDVEMLFLTERRGYRIKEVLVNWSNRDQKENGFRSSRLAKYANESIDMCAQIIRIKLNQLMGKYKKTSPPSMSHDDSHENELPYIARAFPLVDSLQETTRESKCPNLGDQSDPR
ncbi:MAG: glycosyltransferase [Pseudomonadota bacterium]